MTVVVTDRSPAPAPRPSPARRARRRSYAMCAPTHFAVTYAINPWMHPGRPVDRDRALLQWEVLRETYRSLGHDVRTVPALADQPDMVFAANGAVVVGGRAYGAAFRHAERRGEAPAWAAWLADQGVPVAAPRHTNEGEGDFLVLREMILAGTGFRTSVAAHVEAGAVLDRPVVSLELVDPRFYHLDTAVAVLDDGGGNAPADVAWVPSAFSEHSRRTVRALFPDALEVSAADALVLGLNAVGDGRHVVLPAQAVAFAEQLRKRGYEPVPVDLGELLKAGGSVKCCTLELHA